MTVSNYQHHLYPRQSEFVKYRGKTGQIDVKDSILAILSKFPGSRVGDLIEKIYHHTLTVSCKRNIPRAIAALEKDLAIQSDGNSFYYLTSDAISHDIGKTKQSLDKLMELGLTPEQVNFLSSALVMHLEAKEADTKDINYNPNQSHASSIVEGPLKAEPVKEEPVVLDEVRMHEIEHSTNILKEHNEDFIKDLAEYVPGDPFEKMSEAEKLDLMSKVAEDFAMELEASKQEVERLRMEDEDRKREEATLKYVQEEQAKTEELLCKEVANKNEYKNRLANIKSATDILGLDVEIFLPEISGQVVGTILEIKPDGVLFLIVFSTDTLFQEGSIHTLFYKDKLSYKIR